MSNWVRTQEDPEHTGISHLLWKHLPTQEEELADGFSAYKINQIQVKTSLMASSTMTPNTSSVWGPNLRNCRKSEDLHLMVCLAHSFRSLRKRNAAQFLTRDLTDSSNNSPECYTRCSKSKHCVALHSFGCCSQCGQLEADLALQPFPEDTQALKEFCIPAEDRCRRWKKNLLWCPDLSGFNVIWWRVYLMSTCQRAKTVINWNKSASSE